MQRVLKLILFLILTALIFASYAFADTPISCGQVIADSIGVKGESDRYTFTAAANDIVVIRATETSGSLYPYLELYAPGSTVAIATGAGAVDKSLTTAGTYTIVVRDQYNNYTGNYCLIWSKLNPSCVASLNCGQSVVGTIGTTQDQAPWKFYSFTASAGDKVTIRANKTSGTLYPYLELYVSGNATPVAKGLRIIDQSLDIAGQYTIIIRDQYNNYTGNYALVWTRFNNTCAAAIACGQTVTGTIGTTSAQPPWGFYSFNVSAGDTIAIRTAKTSGSLYPYLELYGPGSATAIATGVGDINKALTTAGTYTIVIRDRYGNYTGNYSIIWQRINNPTGVTNLQYGVTVPGVINTSVSMVPYRFTASVGDKITICSAVRTETSGYFDCGLELYDANGNLLTSVSESLKYTFTSGGTFYLFVTDYRRDGTGTYGLILVKGDVSCSLIDFIEPQVSLSRPSAGEIVESGSIYSISWSSSDNIGIATQEIRLSNDSGITYPIVIAVNLDNSVQSYNWQVPASLTSTTARIKVIALDAQGNKGEGVNAGNFIIINTNLPPNSVEVKYDYDRLNRLVKSTLSTAAISYAYDALGNRLSLSGSGAFIPEDINRDGKVDAVDVQLVINAALGLNIGGLNADVNSNGRVDAVDVQLVINKALSNKVTRK